MARKKRTVEYYVRIDPRRLGAFGSGSISDRLIEPDETRRLEDYRLRCEEIVSDIGRHVDNVGSATVESEVEFVCGFCGSGWTEDAESPHNGGCCGKDCDLMESTESAKE